VNASPAIKGAASSPHLRGVFWRVFAAVFVTVMITGTAITFVLPEMYASTARVSVIRDQPDVVGHNWPGVRGIDFVFNTNSPTFDPYFILTTFEEMQSVIVLSNVVVTLNLNAKWGQRYYGGQTLTIYETIALLKKHLQLAPVRNTKLVSITAFSEDRNEAAAIANTVAGCYVDIRQKQQVLATQKSIAILQAQYEDEEQEIHTLQSNLVLLEQQYHIGSGSVDTGKNPDQAIANAKSYLNEKHQLEKRQELHQLLKEKIEYEKNGSLLPVNSGAALTDYAEPGKYPVRPNKPLCLALTLAMATVLGVLAGGVAVWLARRRENAKG